MDNPKIAMPVGNNLTVTSGEYAIMLPGKSEQQAYKDLIDFFREAQTIPEANELIKKYGIVINDKI